MEKTAAQRRKRVPGRRRVTCLSRISLCHLICVVLPLSLFALQMVTQEFERRASLARLVPFERSPLKGRQVTSCSCIRCTSDIECGGIWNGEVLPTSSSSGQFKKIALVVSHCLRPLNWIPSFANGYKIQSVTIISKCNKTVVGAPSGSKIIVLPNVGRCDHSYAHWIRNNYKNFVMSPDVVVFLKDERTEENIHQAGTWTSLSEMLHTSYEQGFACGLRPTAISREAVFWLSAYHETKALMEFNKKEYSHHADIYNNDAEKLTFPSKYDNLGDWAKALRIPLPQELMQACYGGTFAVSMKSIRSHDERMWVNLLSSLSRGDNIEEGHFAERVWGGILAIPPSPYEIMLLRNYSIGVANYTDSYVGTLKRLENT